MAHKRITYPITKKAPGDRQFTQEEIVNTASLIMDRSDEGKVSKLPGKILKEILTLFKNRPAPSILETVSPDASKEITSGVSRMLRKKEIRVKVVDLDGLTGFPRENARPSSEVLLLEKKGKLLSPGKKREKGDKKEKPTIFITKAFLEATEDNRGILLQTIIHPIVEWQFNLPHMIAVLCESNYNAVDPGRDEEALSDLNSFIAQEAANDRDLAYFDRILGTKYEPDEFRIEELKEWFGTELEKRNIVVFRARAMGRKYRALMEKLLKKIQKEISAEHVSVARKALDEGDSDRALIILRKIEADEGVDQHIRNEAHSLIDLAIHCYAIDADPAYEGLRLDGGNIVLDERAGEKSRAVSTLLSDAVSLIKGMKSSAWAMGGKAKSDPLGEKGEVRIIHVLPYLDRPSAKFIDGHDRVHWVFDRRFVEALLTGAKSGKYKRAIPAILACRFVRDGAFPDEKLKIERQFQVAVKGALEGYRFYQSIDQETRVEMNAFYASTGARDRLYHMFISLGEETNVARASRMIRDTVSRSHSFNYVRYPDTSLAGKVIAITGGGTGMGRSLALEAAIRGANVVIMGRRPAPLVETKADMDELIEHLGLKNRTFTVQGDVSDPKYVGEMFEEIKGEFGRIDILYNNAGVSGPVEFGSMYREEHMSQYRDVVNIHLTGAWLGSLEAAKIMKSQVDGGLIVMVGTFYSESIHRHVLHAYPGRLPYTSAQSAKLALGDYLAWVFAEDNISVLSLNPAAVSTERIERGSGVFDKGSKARARIGRTVSPAALEKDTLSRTVTGEFVNPRDFARVALDMDRIEFRRTVGGQRIPMGGVTYEQPPGVVPSPAALHRFPNMYGKTSLVTVDRLFGDELSLIESSLNGLAESGSHIIVAGELTEKVKTLVEMIKPLFPDRLISVSEVNLGNQAEVQELFDRLKGLDLLLHFTGNVDWKRPLTKLSHDEWCRSLDRYGYVPRLLCWQAEKYMDREGIDGTIAIVGPDMSGVPSIRERDLVQVFQAMVRPAIATESMERALMMKAHADGTAPFPVSNINLGLILPGRTDGRNKQAGADGCAASVLWLAGEGKAVSGAVLLPDERNSLSRLPDKAKPGKGPLSGKSAVVTGGIRNLGRAISLNLSREHADVVIGSRVPILVEKDKAKKDEALKALKDGEGTLSEMRFFGGKAIWTDTDISRPERVRQLVDETVNRFGSVDIFVNNAGAGGDFSLITHVMRDHRESWESTLDSNFKGPWYATSYLKNVMANQKDGGVIANVSTHYSDHPYLFRTIYTVSKILMKGLTLSLAPSLAKDKIYMTDIAPSLIAGPRMDWVMKNYATKFADHFAQIEGFSSQEAEALRGSFVSSFDRSLSIAEREEAAEAFLNGVRVSSLKKGARKEFVSWYGRIQEWFRSTVPDVPPTNEQVADAVLYCSKNASFMENRFVGVSPLPPFSSFPPRQRGNNGNFEGRSFLIVSMGWGSVTRDDGVKTGSRIQDKKGRVTHLVDECGEYGEVEIYRSNDPAKGKHEGEKNEKILRHMDIKEPKVLEPWFDNTLLGGPSNSGAVLFFGTTGMEKDILEYLPEDMDRFIDHTGKMLSVFGEALRSISEGGDLIVTVPPARTAEDILIRAAARQMVRTALAEQYFLHPSKEVNISLLTAHGNGERDNIFDLVEGILTGARDAVVEGVPVGPERP